MSIPSLSPVHFSGTAYVLNQVEEVQGKAHHDELEAAVDAQQARIIDDLDDRLELSIGSVDYDPDDEASQLYVENGADPERAEGYRGGDKVDLAHIRLRRNEADPDELKPGYSFVPRDVDLATWIVRKKGQDAASFIRDALQKAIAFFNEDCVPMMEADEAAKGDDG